MFSASQIKGKGFTIVELLIVIVVIAILAAVSVVAYNGIRERAVNSQVQSVLAQTEKALKLYYSETGEPLAVNKAWNHSSITNMAGVCIAGKWPTADEIRDIIGGWYYDHATFCQFAGGNTSQTPTEVMDMFQAEIANSPVASSFPAMPGFEGIRMRAIHGNGTVSEITQRGIRYAYNNNPANRQSYLFYPLYGKQCLQGDVSVRLSDTYWAADGGSVWNGTFTTGGDYTQNNTVHCMRTIGW